MVVVVVMTMMMTGDDACNGDWRSISDSLSHSLSCSITAYNANTNFKVFSEQKTVIQVKGG